MQHILAVKSEAINKRLLQPGFVVKSKPEIVDLLLEGGMWIGPRHELEQDEGYRQIIPYVVLRSDNKIMSYMRSSAGKEQRLHGSKSIGFGGHIDIGDVCSDGEAIDIARTIDAAAVRECVEEVGPLKVLAKEWLGLIIDHSNEVGRVHLGIVAVWTVEPSVVSAADKAVVHQGFSSKEALLNQSNAMETWSNLVIPYL